MEALATIALKRFGSQIAAPGASSLFSDIAAGFAEWETPSLSSRMGALGGRGGID